MLVEITVEKTVFIPMRDGVKLAADIYKISGAEPMPVLLRRLPYNKELPKYLVNPDTMQLVQAGFAVVVQDVRGTGASDGDFYPFIHEADDGEDTINWIASQPWCNGNVGMFGSSYHGMTQWLATKNKPKALKAIAPHMSPYDLYDDLCYQGGAFELGNVLGWTDRIFLNEVVKRIERTGLVPESLEKVLEKGGIPWNIDTLPIEKASLFSEFWPVYRDWLKNGENSEYWKRVSCRGSQNIPALISGGWYDIFLRGTLSQYLEAMKKDDTSKNASINKQLIIGPWAHTNYTGNFPDRDYGNGASIDAIGYNKLLIQWFNKWLKGIEEFSSNSKPVKIFVMGINQWRDEEAWPLPDTNYISYYLHSKGQANTSSGDGFLSTVIPGEDFYDELIFDPNNPVPTIGGSVHFPNEYIGGPRNQNKIAQREDVLCYTTTPLEKDIEVTGPIELELYISSDALDTDFTGKLVDIHPNGQAFILAEGIVRTRYRNSKHSAELMEPGRIYKLTIDLAATANVFKSGHCIRLEISSSNFPKYDRNSNTGKKIYNEEAKEFKVAINRVFHTSKYPSRIILPIIDRI